MLLDFTSVMRFSTRRATVKTGRSFLRQSWAYANTLCQTSSDRGILDIAITQTLRPLRVEAYVQLADRSISFVRASVLKFKMTFAIISSTASNGFQDAAAAPVAVYSKALA